MGIRRRRRRRLSTTLLQVDKRLRSLERRKAPKRIQPRTVTEEKLDPNVLDLSSEDVANTPNGTQAPDIPIVHKRIIFRARLSRRSRSIPSIYYIETDFAHELQAGDKVTISGISERFDGTHTVEGVQDPFQFSYTKEWDGDNSLANASQVVSVINKQCTTTTATISFSGSFSNPFRVGDTIEVDGLGAPFDGVFVVTSRPSTTSITYDFDEPQTAVPSTPTSGGAYPTALRYVVVGSTWRDSTNQNLYQWDGIKWVLVNAGVPDNVVIDDNLAPNPPTNLNGTSTAYFDGNLPRARVVLTWDAPEFNTDSSLLTDLEGFEIFKRYDPGDDWELEGTSVTETFTVLNLLQNKLTYFMVRAKDITGNRSTDSGSFSLTTAVSSVAVIIPSTPTATTRLGTITVRWDGLDYLGNTLDTLPAFSYVEVHQSTTTGFTPSATTLVDRLIARGFYVAANLTYGTPYYFKFVAVDAAGNKTTGSAQATATTARLVDTDLIANTLSTWPFAGNVVSAGSLASGAINASTLFGPNVVVQNAIAANAIGADQIAAGSIVAGKIGANAITSNTIAANAITAGKIDTNAVTADTILAGAITGDKIEANAINGKVITGATVRTSSNVSRVEMNTSGLFVYNSGTPVISLNNDGSASIGGWSITSTSIRKVVGTRTTTLDANSGFIDVYDTNTGFLGGGAISVGTPLGTLSVTPSGLSIGSDAAIDVRDEFGGYSGNVRIYTSSGRYIRLVPDAGGFRNTFPVSVEGSLDVLGRIQLNGNLNAPNIPSTTSAANVRWTTGGVGQFQYVTSSSIRFKDNVTDITNVPSLNPKVLLDLPVRAFTYKPDYISSEDDRFDVMVPGFIAEEVDAVYPIATDYDENGPVSWNDRFIVPALLSLIQDLYKKVEELENK